MEIKKLLNQLGLSEYIAFDFETTGLSSDDDRISSRESQQINKS